MYELIIVTIGKPAIVCKVCVMYEKQDGGEVRGVIIVIFFLRWENCCVVDLGGAMDEKKKQKQEFLGERRRRYHCWSGNLSRCPKRIQSEADAVVS